MRRRARRARWLGLGFALAVCLADAAPAAEPSDEIARLRAALEANPADEAARSALGDAFFREGYALDSMVVLNPQATPDARWAPELVKAAGVFTEIGELHAARRALEDATRLDPADVAAREALAALRARSASAGTEPARAEPEPARAEAAAPPPTAKPAPARASPPAREQRAIAPPRVRRAIAATVLLAGAGLAFVLLRRRARGDVAVTLELPAHQRGTFSVRLAHARERAPAQPSLEPLARASSRFEHNLIARETHFRGVPARTYWVTVEGVVESEGGPREAVRHDREVAVARGLTARVAFDLRPQACPIELRVSRAGRPAGDARIALGGDPTSVRLAKGGRARLALAKGRHSLLIGARDRAAERTLAVAGFDALTVEVDLDDPSQLVFWDCEAAVEPFLRGDLSVAAAALERSGQRERADLLLGRFHQSRGAAENAAARFEAAGRWLEAAEVRAQQGEAAKAALLFERGGDLARAAEMYEAEGDLLRAGRAHEESGDLERAIACYREANAPRLLDALEKMGDAFEAGMLARERGDSSRAARNLQQVEARDEQYVLASRMLASIYAEQGKLELAVQKADEAISFSRADEISPDTFVWYAELLARTGRPERALSVFEDLARHQPEQPGVATRIEELRKAISGAKRESSATQPVAAFEAGRYEVLEEIGRGGMGLVFRARDRRLGREVALKRLPDQLKDHPKAVELFLREARAAAALNHPNIVTVHDVDSENGVFFITMELLVGGTLADVLKKRKRLAALDVCRIGVQACQGLAYAHAQRIIHRDVKTANLFLTDDRIVKIMDFGLAKMLEEVRRSTTVVGGTPYYMAPEQAGGESVDARADLYAFGVTLFELATGRRPFESGDVTYHHRHTPPPDPRAVHAGIPDALAELVLELLAKRPGERPASAEQVGRRLQQIAQQQRR